MSDDDSDSELNLFAKFGVETKELSELNTEVSETVKRNLYQKPGTSSGESEKYNLKNCRGKIGQNRRNTPITNDSESKSVIWSKKSNQINISGNHGSKTDGNFKSNWRNRPKTHDCESGSFASCENKRSNWRTKAAASTGRTSTRFGPSYPNRNLKKNRKYGVKIERSERTREKRTHDSYKKIAEEQFTELAEMESDQLILALIERKSILEELFETGLTFNKLVLSLQIIEKLCKSSDNDVKRSIIQVIIDKEVLRTTINYLMILALQDVSDKHENALFWSDPERFWKNLQVLYSAVLDLVPKTASELLPKVIRATIVAVNDVKKQHGAECSEEILMQFENLKEEVVKLVEDTEKKTKVEQPPDNFRWMSVYPKTEEITTRETPFLRPIIKDGAYESVEHYLDVQFRLLREDYLASLRNGICAHLENSKGPEKVERSRDVRIHKNVFFIRPYVLHDRVGHLVQYSSRVNLRFFKENSKHMMYGSLICFTKDNFRSIIYSTVIDSDIRLLRNGQIAVDVLGNVDFDTAYTMVESTVYFEPYHLVLQALQWMPTDNFPFKQYIIDVSPQISHPKYLTESTEVLQGVSVVRDIIRLAHRRFKMLSLDAWPSARHFKLNESQFRAFQAALTREFSVIQGPPGTGKTHTTIQIVKFLLTHKRTLNYSGPILVVCLTNHALDQFLKHILKFNDNIVRVGNQSKDEELHKYNLRNLRENSSGFLTRYWLKNFMEKMLPMQHLINDITANLGIIDFRIFNDIDIYLQNSWFSKARPQQLINWLMEGSRDEKNIDHQNLDDDIAEHLDFYNQVNREDNERRQLIDDDFSRSKNIANGTNFIKTLADYSKDINSLRSRISDLRNDPEKRIIVADLREDLNMLIAEQRYLKWRLQYAPVKELQLEKVDYNWPHEMNPDDRWALYRHWLRLLVEQECYKIYDMDEKYRDFYSYYQESREMDDIRVLERRSVIGMTTNGAARYQNHLQSVKCPIVIVEEAAEVLESHIIVSLTEHCQQLILIGDHQQLRPTAAQYFLAKKYNLEISMFERMVRNGIHCHQLDVQHRMRPEIASLIVPAIYEKLENHFSVESYKPIRGMCKNLFFITHTEPEEEMYHSTSHTNVYEAKYLIKLAHYLLLQGYEPKDITILTTYFGQTICLLEERKAYPELKDVHITVVDNFQGEENKIILLSLVRSNKEANIGFLKTENRVCVALSRAKEGFYIIGNMDNLTKSSTIWTKVNRVLIDQDAIGPVLRLRCQVECNETPISTLSDFENVSEGGCAVPCLKQLECGHVCALKCHVYDRLHELYQCEEDCTRILCEKDHSCPRKCFKPCTNCLVPTETTLSCGHTHSVPCFLVNKQYVYGNFTQTLEFVNVSESGELRCPTIVNVVLDCGHERDIECHMDKKYVACPHPCKMDLPCGHFCADTCHFKTDPQHLKYTCKMACKKSNADCTTQTHKCMKQCWEQCLPCEEFTKKKRTLCTHSFKVPCNSDVDKLICKKSCRRQLPCGHHCRKKCFQPCGGCYVTVTKKIEACGHSLSVKCYQEISKKMCQEMCCSTLLCGHPCPKKCCEDCGDCKICEQT